MIVEMVQKLIVINHQNHQIYCLNFENKAAHLPFDEYLRQKKSKCSHNEKDECINCKHMQNLQLSVDLSCKNHLPYPKGLCSKCMPENISLKRQ